MRRLRKKTPKLAMLGAMGLMLSVVSARSDQLLDYTTFGGYAIGKGILGNDYSQPLPSCIKGEKTAVPASSTRLQVSITYNAEEYKKAFHIDQSAQASFLNLGSVSGEVHFGQETGRSGSAFDIIIEANSEYPSETLDNVKWSEPYATMMTSGDPAKIRQVRQSCGERFIQTVFNEVRLFAVLHVSAVKPSSILSLSGKVNGTLNVNSASASLGGDDKISSAIESGAITIDIFSQGLSGFPPTAAVLGIGNSDGLSAIAEKLAKHLSSLQTTGQPVKYQLAPLPLMQLEDAADVRLIQILADLKSAYDAGATRSFNMRALLPPNSDLRRLVLRQPQADAALRDLQASLSAYLNKLVDVHALCRKTNKYSECQVAYDGLPPVPQPARVELPPLVPPSMAGFSIAINGIPIPAAQSAIYMSNAKSSLFEIAKSLNPAAQNVDVLALVPSAYMSHIEVLSADPQRFQPPNFNPYPGRGLLLPQQIGLPGYFPADKVGSAIIVLHADAEHPCPVTEMNGMPSVDDEECLTLAGRLLYAALLSNATNYVVATAGGTPQNYSIPVMASLLDCFNNAQSVPIGWINIKVTKSWTDVTAEYSLLLPMAAVSYGQYGVQPSTVPVYMTFGTGNEKYDSKKWEQLKIERLAALSKFGKALPGPGACSPRIP